MATHRVQVLFLSENTTSVKIPTCICTTFHIQIILRSCTIMYEQWCVCFRVFPGKGVTCGSHQQCRLGYSCSARNPPDFFSCHRGLFRCCSIYTCHLYVPQKKMSIEKKWKSWNTSINPQHIRWKWVSECQQIPQISRWWLRGVRGSCFATNHCFLLSSDRSVGSREQNRKRTIYNTW